MLGFILDAYKPAELEELQVAELPSALPSSLSNAIHPIYFRTQWDDCPDDVFELLTPSIRLASLMITSPASLAFFDVVLNGSRKSLSKLTVSMGGKGCYELQPLDRDVSDPAYPQLMHEVSGYLAAVKSHIRLRVVENVAKKTLMFGFTRRDLSHVVKSGDWVVGTGTTIHMGSEFVTNLRKVRAKGSVSQLLRLQFSTAITLAHETAHAVNHTVSMETYEPFFDDQRLAEIGHAWEQAVFGGIVRCLGHEDARNPLAFCKWPNASPTGRSDIILERRLPKRLTTFYFLPMTFISSAQQADFWATAGDSSKLRIPKRHGRQVKGWGPDFDPDWVSEDSSEGRHPGGRLGRVNREDLADDWENVDEPAEEALDWDDFGIKLPQSPDDDEIMRNDISLTASMIEDFQAGMDLTDLEGTNVVLRFAISLTYISGNS